MSSLEYFIVAESVSIDHTTNQLSIFNILEELHPMGFPATLGQIAIVSVFRFLPVDIGRTFEVSLTIRLPSGPFDVQRHSLPVVHRRHRVVTRIVGLPLPAEGELVIEVALDGIPLGSHNFLVSRADAPVPPMEMLLN